MYFSAPYPPSSERDESSTDSDLVLQAQEGDDAAFEELYRRYSRRICSYLTYMVDNAGIGCELTQDTFLKAWRALPNLRNRASFAAWLYQIATHIAQDHQRRTGPLHWLPWEERSLEGSGKMSIAGPEEHVEAEELLRAALASLPEKQRACLILYHVQGLSIAQIAELLGIKEGSVKVYVSLGLKQLLHTLHEDDTSDERQD